MFSYFFIILATIWVIWNTNLTVSEPRRLGLWCQRVTKPNNAVPTSMSTVSSLGRNVIVLRNGTGSWRVIRTQLKCYVHVSRMPEEKNSKKPCWNKTGWGRNNNKVCKGKSEKEMKEFITDSWGCRLFRGSDAPRIKGGRRYSRCANYSTHACIWYIQYLLGYNERLTGLQQLFIYELLFYVSEWICVRRLQINPHRLL